MERIGDMAGLIKTQPGIALAMTAFSLSALGLPPFSGFWAKFYVFKAAIGAGLGWVAALALVFSVVGAFYYLRLIKTMWFEPAPEGTAAVDKPAPEIKGLAYAAALFSFPLVLIALVWLDPLAKAAAAALGQ
jgi:NADH-quinone oxidoreductase subunit N